MSRQENMKSKFLVQHIKIYPVKDPSKPVVLNVLGISSAHINLRDKCLACSQYSLAEKWIRNRLESLLPGLSPVEGLWCQTHATSSMLPCTSAQVAACAPATSTDTNWFQFVHMLPVNQVAAAVSTDTNWFQPQQHFTVLSDDACFLEVFAC